MPIRRVGGREGPLDGAPGGVTLDVAVRGDVFLIVQDDERVPNNWAVECDGPRASKMQRMTTRFLPVSNGPLPGRVFAFSFLRLAACAFARVWARLTSSTLS